MKQPYVVPSTTRRDLLIGLAVGLAVLALLLFTFMNLGSGVAGATLKGIVVAKHFTPFKEEQVVIGKRGMQARQIDGEYVLECDVKGRLYLVTVEKELYEGRKIGDPFYFARPPK